MTLLAILLLTAQPGPAIETPPAPKPACWLVLTWNAGWGIEGSPQSVHAPTVHLHWPYLGNEAPLGDATVLVLFRLPPRADNYAGSDGAVLHCENGWLLLELSGAKRQGAVAPGWLDPREDWPQSVQVQRVERPVVSVLLHREDR